MGAEDGPHPEDGEGPIRNVWLSPFSISATQVTNREYSAFVQATGYRTLAERAGWSFVFHLLLPAALRSAPRAAHAPWWHAIEGAHWSAPEGPGSTANDRPDHPVVHVALEDALAFCRWSGTRLPTEAEWEYAARGGVESQPFPWGAELEPGGIHFANVWQGDFPNENTADDGYVGPAPVGSYPANGFGLYDTIGNVWEWTSDRFANVHSPRDVRNPTGPLNGGHFSAKGGSYLCHASYCARYRNSSRQALAPDTTTGNIGFRVVA